MRWIFSIVLTLSLLTALAWLRNDKKTAVAKTSSSKKKPLKAEGLKKELARLNDYGSRMESFAKQNNFNSRYCFLVDMKLPSGRNRFFIYDMKQDSVLEAGLVTHGSGSNFGDSLHFSNTPESQCTSIGKYKIGNSYSGKFGLAYKLHGLDATNSRAFERFVVLHSHSCVPAEEVEPQLICESWGCPTVAPTFLTDLKTYLDKTEKPMLLWIFY